MALIEAQMQAVKQNLEEAMGGSKSAQTYFRTLRDGGQWFQVEMLDYAIELVSTKGVSQDAPIAGINLQGFQIGSARKTLAKLKLNPNEFDAKNFWTNLEKGAAAGDAIQNEFIKAREIILKEMADDTSPDAPKLPDWLTGEIKTNPATPQAQAQASSRPPTFTQPAQPVQTPVSAFTQAEQIRQVSPHSPPAWDPSQQKVTAEYGTWPGAPAAPGNGTPARSANPMPAATGVPAQGWDGYAATLALRDEIKGYRDEILGARDQILEALFKKEDKKEPEQAHA